jgi:hypothetical protein
MARLGSLSLKTLHTSYINKNWKETAQCGPVELENMFLIVFPSHLSWKNLSSKSSYRPHASAKDFDGMTNAHGKKCFPEFLTESFERIPLLDSQKGWSFITTQVNKMACLAFSQPSGGSNLKS